MRIKLIEIKTLTFLLILSINVNAQQFTIKNHSIGYRIFEFEAIGSASTNIAPLLKDPVTYQSYLNTIEYNSFWGNPSPVTMQNLYINTEWYKNNPSSRFWRKYMIQTGLLFTIKIARSAGAIGHETFYYTPDTPRHVYKYSLIQKQQFFGANAGLNRRIKISKKLQFLTGLHGQGSFALVHYYKQQWDSSTFTPQQGIITRTTKLSNIKGKNFFQWQAMIPLALEYELYKKCLFLRLEADAGIVGGCYRGKSFWDKEAYGAGLWIIYQRK